MEFRILGSLEVQAAGTDVTPAGAKARALLALLILHANEPVSVDRLLDEVWGAALPENAAKTLQIHVSRLRKSLGDARLQRVGGGYSLRLDDGELDASRAARLVADGSELLVSGDARGADEAFGQALALFRGPPLADFDHEPFAQADIAQLGELRLQAVEGRLEARLELGEGARLVAELESLVAAHPLRERLRGQLMRALYRDGRQADALDAYRSGRRLLVEELGLEPGPELQALERRILTQDPALAPTVRSGRPGARRLRSPALLVAVVVGAAAVVAVGLAVLLRRDAGPAPALPAQSLGRVDPRRLVLTDVVGLGGTPSDVAVGRRAVFVALPGRSTVVTVDPASGASTALGAPLRPTRVAWAGEGVWLLDGPARRVALLGSQRKYAVPEVAGTGPGAALDAMVAAGSSLFLAERDSEFLFSVDRRTGAGSPIDSGGRDSFFEGPARRALAAAAGSVWASNPVSVFPATERLGRVARVDAATGEVIARIRLPAPPVALAATPDAVWVALERGDAIWRIDARDDVPAASVRVGEQIVDLAAGAGSVWALGRSGVLTRIDPGTGEISGRLELGRGRALAVGRGAVWIAAA